MSPCGQVPETRSIGNHGKKRQAAGQASGSPRQVPGSAREAQRAGHAGRSREAAAPARGQATAAPASPKGGGQDPMRLWRAYEATRAGRARRAFEIEVPQMRRDGVDATAFQAARAACPDKQAGLWRNECSDATDAGACPDRDSRPGYGWQPGVGGCMNSWTGMDAESARLPAGRSHASNAFAPHATKQR